MTLKLDLDGVIHHLKNTWGQKPCSMCGHSDWTVSDKVFELREYHQGSFGIGGSILPIIPVTCNNCGNTLFVNAIQARLVEKPDQV